MGEQEEWKPRLSPSCWGRGRGSTGADIRPPLRPKSRAQLEWGGVGQLAWRRMGWGSRPSAKSSPSPWGSLKEPPERRAHPWRAPQVLALALRLLTPPLAPPPSPRLPPPPRSGRGAGFSAGTWAAGARGEAEAENPEVHPKPTLLGGSWLISFRQTFPGGAVQRDEGRWAAGMPTSVPGGLSSCSLQILGTLEVEWGRLLETGGAPDHSLAKAPHSAQEERFFLLGYWEIRYCLFSRALVSHLKHGRSGP